MIHLRLLVLATGVSAAALVAASGRRADLHRNARNRTLTTVLLALAGPLVNSRSFSAISTTRNAAIVSESP